MSAVWLFDIGNTRLKAAALQSGDVGEIEAFAHGEAALPAHIHGEVAWVASVAPSDVRVAWLETLATRFGRVHLARTLPQAAGVRIAYAEPARLGVDRFLALLGARHRGAGAALVVGVGTALTVDLLDAHGVHVGGRIAPSPTLMRETLAAKSQALPVGGGDYVEFANDTLHALASGCEGAALGLIERSLQQARAQLGEEVTLWLHGGGTPALLSHLPNAQHAPKLVLEGLARWASLGDAA